MKQYDDAFIENAIYYLKTKRDLHSQKRREYHVLNVGLMGAEKLLNDAPVKADKKESPEIDEELQAKELLESLGYTVCKTENLDELADELRLEGYTVIKPNRLFDEVM